MFIQAQIPRTRLAITPTNVRSFCLDSTPNRSQLNVPQRFDEKQLYGQVNDRQKLIIHSSKENLTRIPGNSFCQSSSLKELQNQISELIQQRDTMQYTLQEAIRKSNIMEQQLEVFD